jgi:taurine transport system permease protein
VLIFSRVLRRWPWPRAGVRSVSLEQINAAYSMGASKWQVIWHVVIPAAMPEILTGMHCHRLRLTTPVAAEMIAAMPASARWY